MLNIGVCPTVIPDPTNPGDTKPPTDPNSTPSDDTTPPSVAISADRLLAGGTTQGINITGTVLDTHLAGYRVAINGNVAQSESNMTSTQASINIPWNVATPNVVPSDTYTITLDATDTAGNIAHTEISVEVDNTAPTVTVDGGDVIIKSGSISPKTSADDKNGIASYSWTSDPNNPSDINYDGTVAKPTFTPTVEGSYAFYVAVSDGLGNVTNKEFDFSYAKALETIPLPTTQDPTSTLVDQSPSTVVAAPTAPNATVRSGHDELTANDTPDVLGATSTALGQTPPIKTIASIAPTDRGWSIFGLLWYWWVAAIGMLIVGWRVVKRLVHARIPEHS